MERPDYFTLKNGDKAKLPFSEKEYQRRLYNLRNIMNKKINRRSAFRDKLRPLPEVKYDIETSMKFLLSCAK